MQIKAHFTTIVIEKKNVSLFLYLKILLLLFIYLGYILLGGEADD